MKAPWCERGGVKIAGRVAPHGVARGGAARGVAAACAVVALAWWPARASAQDGGETRPMSAILDASPVDSVGQAFMARLRARDAAGVAALVNAEPLRDVLRQLSGLRGAPGSAPPPMSAEQRRRIDPGITEEEIRLISRLDSLRRRRTGGRTHTYFQGMRIASDSVETLPPAEFFRQALEANFKAERDTALCPPGMRPPRRFDDAITFVGAVMMTEHEGYLLALPRSMGPVQPSPLEMPPEYFLVRRTVLGWQIDWDQRLHARLAMVFDSQCSGG